MTETELKCLKHYDSRVMASLSLTERADYITLLKKLRHEVQLALSFLQPNSAVPHAPDHKGKRSHRQDRSASKS